MGRYSFMVDVEAPRAHVFDLWIDLDRLTEWMQGVTRVTDITGPADQVGTKYRIWFGPLSAEAEVLAAERPLYIRTRLRLGSIKTEMSTFFEASDDGTRLREAFTTHGLAGTIWARILGAGSYRGSFLGELRQFARLVEQT